jgi:hypothetical protein
VDQLKTLKKVPVFSNPNPKKPDSASQSSALSVSLLWVDARQRSAMNEKCEAKWARFRDPTFFHYSRHASQGKVREALKGNLVKHLSLDFSPNLASLETQEDEEACIALVLSYARRRMVMRALHVLNATIEPIRQCLRVLEANPRIREFALNDCDKDQIPVEELATLLRDTKTLKKLDVDLILTENRLVAEGLGANRSLESLILTTPLYDVVEEVLATGHVLYHLTNHTSLRYLELFPLSVENDMYLALSHYLARAPALEHLNFHSMSFDKNWTEHLVEGLAARKMIQKLEFTLCYFEEEATSVLTTLAGTYYDDDAQKIQIQHLEVNDEMNLGNSIAWITAIALGTTCSFLDLHSIEVPVDMDDFWATLSTQSAKICLRDLHISYFPHASSAAMMASIPQWVHVQELHFDKGIDNEDEGQENVHTVLQEFCRAVWCNGSLRIVSANKRFQDFQRCIEMRIVRASLKRNHRIPQLLSIPDVQRRAHRTLYIANGSIYPTLLEAGKQARRLAPNSLLMGVTAMGRSIGPRIQAKRLP